MTSVELAMLSATGVVVIDENLDFYPVADATIVFNLSALDAAQEHNVRAQITETGANGAVVYLNTRDPRVVYLTVKDRIYRKRSVVFSHASVIAIRIDYDGSSEEHLKKLNP